METIGELRPQLSKLDRFQQSQKIISLLDRHPAFQRVSQEELRLLQKRDREDREKLHRGITIAVQKGAIPPSEGEKPWRTIYADNKLPDHLADEILSYIPDGSARAVIAICGESGVGKGTTADRLTQALDPCIQWSNGNMFRCLTFLVLEKTGGEDVTEERMRSIDMGEIMSNISIDSNDTIIIHTAAGAAPLERMVTTQLKESRINRNLPTVAKYTQGEVIRIANTYFERNYTLTIVIEGRKETLAYAQATHRFELRMRDKGILGKRRAAQKLIEQIELHPACDLSVTEFIDTYYT